MMKMNSTNRRPSAALVVASLALFVALSGSAVAAKGLISGKQIAKETITSKNIKNRTLKKKDLNAKTIASLRGATGPQGPAGKQGPAGPQGPAGVAKAVAASSATVNLTANDDVTVINRSLAKGKYLLLAKTNLFTTSSDNLACRIEAGGNDLDRAQWNPTGNNVRNAVSLQAVSGEITGAKLICHGGDATGSAFDSSLIAVPVA